MAIDLGTETPTFNKSDRTIRIVVYVDDDGTIRFEFNRELVYRNGGNVIVHRRLLKTVERTQAQIGTKQYTAGGVTRTGNQILLLLDRMSDDERQIDINNGA